MSALKHFSSTNGADKLQFPRRLFFGEVVRIETIVQSSEHSEAAKSEGVQTDLIRQALLGVWAVNFSSKTVPHS